MPIRIKCPKCQTVLGVKDTLAGKKVNCPKCRFLLAVPVPKTAAPVEQAVDAETLALSTFADEPAKVEAAPTKFIEFECNWCMEPVKLPAELAGKQAPCPNPECKRIIKVPLLKEDKPRDWRQSAPRGPSGAMRKDGDEPEGAWSTAQKTRVSSEALLEAGAIPVKKVPVSTTTIVRRSILAGVAVVALIGGVWGFFAWSANRRITTALAAAVEAAEQPGPKLKPSSVSELFRGVGEFHAMRKDAKKAAEHFGKAREQYKIADAKTPADLERDAVLLELMLSVIDLGADAGGDTKIDWGEVRNFLRQSLERTSSTEGKLIALREVANKLNTQGQLEIAVYLAEQLAPSQIIETDQPQVDDGEGNPAPKQQPKKVTPTPMTAAHVALLLGNNEAAKAAKILALPAAPKEKEKDKGKEPDLDPLVRMAYAEGKARKGDFDGARQLANNKTGTTLARLEACLAVASVALADNKPAEAKSSAQDALAAYEEMRKKKEKTPSALLVQLTRVLSRTDQAAQAKEIVNAIPEKTDRPAKALAQLEMALPLLETAAEPLQLTALDDSFTLKDTVAYSVAVEKLARLNTRLGRRSDALAMLDTLDEAHRPFVQLGVALGLVEPRK